MKQGQKIEIRGDKGSFKAEFVQFSRGMSNHPVVIFKRETGTLGYTDLNSVSVLEEQVQDSAKELIGDVLMDIMEGVGHVSQKNLKRMSDFIQK